MSTSIISLQIAIIQKFVTMQGKTVISALILYISVDQLNADERMRGLLCPHSSNQNIIRYPYSGDSTKYWECFQTRLYVMNCPKGLEFHFTQQQCAFPEIAQRQRAQPNCPSNVEQEYFPYDGDCTKYWECSYGVLYPFTCPDGLYWNQAISECDYPENVDCENGSTVSPTSPNTSDPPFDPSTDPSFTTTPELETSSAQPTYSEPSEESSTSSTTEENGWTPDPQCPYPSDEEVFFPNEGDCTKYWMCYQGNKYEFSCLPGLYWNQEKLYCDYPTNVECLSEIK